MLKRFSRIPCSDHRTFIRLKCLSAATLPVLSMFLWFPHLAAPRSYAVSLQPATHPVQEKSAILQLFKHRDSAIKKILGPAKPSSSDYSNEQKAKLKELINGILDVKAMAQLALGSTWKTLTDEQKTDFVDSFSALIKKTSLRKLDIYRAHIDYKKVDLQDERSAVLQTIATYKNKKTHVDYRLHKDNGQWRVTDFLLDDVSTVEAYHNSFRKIIRKHGFDGLLTRIKKKIKPLKSGPDEG